LHGLSGAFHESEADTSTSAAATTTTMAKHIVFVDDERELERFDAVKHFDTVPEAVDRVYNRPRKSTLADADVRAESDEAVQIREQRYDELRQRAERLNKIERMRVAMSLRKALKGKGRRHRIVSKSESANGVAQYKWSRERMK